MSEAVGRVMLLLSVLTLAGLLLLSQGCSTAPEEDGAVRSVSAQSDGSEEPTVTIPEEEPLYTATYTPNGNEIAVITTSKGVIEFEFFEEDAPNHVASFIERAKEGFYDGTKFHRVVPDFVIQGGDPLSRTDDPRTGTGGPGYRLAAEFNSRPHLEGTVAMARSTDPDSAGSQFYICLAPQPSLDGQYTVFGQVTEGMDVVHSIEVGDVIESIVIKNAD